MSDYHEDSRGWIKDLIQGPDYAVTHIFTKAGAVRGNHYHEHTTQTVHVLTGRLLVRYGWFKDKEVTSDPIQKIGRPNDKILNPGDSHEETPMMVHAWQACGDTEVIVVTRGPRSGDQYESDVIRLTEPLL